MPFCPVCNLHFKRREDDRWFCSPLCRREALAILDASENELVQKRQATEEFRAYTHRLEERLEEFYEENTKLLKRIQELEECLVRQT